MATTKKRIYRQGDVLIERIAAKSVPVTTTEVPREQGRVVLAHGEATGHAHALDAVDAKLLSAEEGRFLLLNESAHPDLVGGGIVPGTVIESVDDLIRFRREDGTLIRFAPSSVEPVDGGLRVREACQLLRHEEHDAHALPIGTYRVTRQREYAPEAVRNVAD